MIAKLLSVRAAAWGILFVMIAVMGVTIVGRVTNIIDASLSLFVLEPIMALVAAGIAYYVGRGLSDRIRHKSDKAYIVGSVVAIWFVCYFLSGLVTTYSQNALVTNWQGVGTNILAFGIVVICLEFVRYKVMLLASRRNVVWFGIIIAIVFGLVQVNLAQMIDIDSAEALVKAIVANVLPAMVASFLLTYLAFTSGLPAQLTYQLGVLATVLLPPIIPKYDWYLLGISSILLTVAVYIMIDRSHQDSEGRQRPSRRPARRAYDVMFIASIIGLAMFMTGFFSYHPMAVVSNSMQPIFSRGAMVIVERVDNPMDVSIGDIIQYQVPGKMITHRVVEIDSASDGSGERVFITKGDNSPSRDQPVAGQQIIGIIRAQIPYIGYPSVWLKEL